jgi:hypothetical protein
VCMHVAWLAGTQEYLRPELFVEQQATVCKSAHPFLFALFCVHRTAHILLYLPNVTYRASHLAALSIHHICLRNECIPALQWPPHPCHGLSFLRVPWETWHWSHQAT